MSEVLYYVDAIAVLAFFLSYYFNCYRKGFKVDVWHTYLFLNCVLVDQLMLPFAGSDLNRYALGGLVTAAQESIARAFDISLCGFIAIWIGGALWNTTLGLGLRDISSSILEFIPRQSRLLMSSRQLLVFQAFACLMAEIVLAAVYFKNSGFGFDLRAYSFENPSLRPIAMAVSSYSVVIASHSFARYMDTKERSLLIYIFLLTFGLLPFGARSDLVAIFFMVFLCYLMKRRRRVKLIWIAAIVVMAVFMGMYLGALRSGIYSITAFMAMAVFAIFYGNSFSDLRDFSLLLTCWNGHFWFGKTYLAAAFAFVPRFLSTYRNEWSIGVVTATMAGFNPREHPGLRPGIFGESYFNFGYLGVIAMGLLVGVILRKVDREVKREMNQEHPSITRAFSYTVLIVMLSDVVITAGVSSMYMLLLVFAISAVCRRLLSAAAVFFGHPPGLIGARKV